MRPQPSCRLQSIPSSPPTRDKPCGRCAGKLVVTIALAPALRVVIGALLGLLGGGGSTTPRLT